MCRKRICQSFPYSGKKIKAIFFIALVLLFIYLISGCSILRNIQIDEEHEKIRHLVEKGSSSYVANHFNNAFNYYDQALTISLRLKEKKLTSDIYFRMGRLWLKQQQYTKALSAFKQSLNLLEKKDERGNRAILHHNIGVVYQGLGQIDSARAHYKQALELRRAINDHLGQVRILINIAETDMSQGLYIKALERYNKAKIVLKKIEPQQPEEMAALLIHLGSLHAELGQYEKALQLINQALKLYQQGNNNAGIATALLNIGYVYAEQGKSLEAIDYFNRVLLIYDTDEKLNESIARATALNNLGLTLSKVKKTSQALDKLTKALQIFQQLKAQKLIAVTLDSIGTVHQTTGNYSLALKYYHRALIIWRELNVLDGERITLGNIGTTLELQNKDELAILFYKQSVNVTEAIRYKLKILSEKAQQAYINRIKKFYYSLVELLITQGRIAEAEQVLAMIKEEEYSNFIRGETPTDGRAIRASYNSNEKNWLQLYRDFSSQLVSQSKEYSVLEKKTNLTDNDKKRLIELEDKLDQAQAAFIDILEGLHQTIQQDADDAILDYGERRLSWLESEQKNLSKLGHGAVFIHTVIAKDNVYLLLTTPKVQLVRRSNITSNELNHLILRFRQALQQRNSEYQAYALKLYNNLVQPLESDLKDANAQTLLWSLDGALRYIPMAALFDGQSYLIQRYSLALYTPASRSNLILMGDDLWQVAGLGVSQKQYGFTALPAVPRELEAIILQNNDDQDGVVPGVIYLDDTFDRDHFKQVLRAEYPVVHIASHFKLQPGDNRRSFLLLGGGDKLNLDEFRKKRAFKLSNVELLTLSACNTAMAGGTNGSEVESFGVLAQKRGAASVLATLWPVADHSTGVFMQEFYRLNSQYPELTKAEALRQAQLSLLQGESVKFLSTSQDERGVELVNSLAYEQEKTSDFSHPYFWAPFILMGNWL